MTMANNQSACIDNTSLVPWVGGVQLVSGANSGRPAIYDERSQAYQQHICIQNDTSFSMEAYTITSGPHKGCRAIVLVPMGSFRFLDLPPEVRNEIYSLLLKRPRPIELKAYSPSGQKPRVVQGSFRYGKKASKRWDQTLKKRIGGWRDPNAVSILFTNRQIHDEAAKILYGANRFAFQNSNAVKVFFRLISTSVLHLRHIFLLSNKLPDLEISLKTLAAAKGLRKIELPHHTICASTLLEGHSFKHAEALLPACMALLRSMAKIRKENGIAGNVADVFASYHCGCSACKNGKTFSKWHLHCYCPKASLKEGDKDFWAVFRKQTGEYLASLE